jgi:hypothetical protein
MKPNRRTVLISGLASDVLAHPAPLPRRDRYPKGPFWWRIKFTMNFDNTDHLLFVYMPARHGAPDYNRIWSSMWRVIQFCGFSVLNIEEKAAVMPFRQKGELPCAVIAQADVVLDLSDENKIRVWKNNYGSTDDIDVYVSTDE